MLINMVMYGIGGLWDKLCIKEFLDFDEMDEVMMMCISE